MTPLSAVHIADLCRKVGFGRPDLYIATATAVASSGGNPAYEHAIYPGPVALYKGLWGVDLCQHELYVGEDLADPLRAAEAAYDLTVEHSGFSWCPAYRSGAYHFYVDRAREASSMVPGAVRDTTPIALYPHLEGLQRREFALARTYNALQDHRLRRR